MAHRLETCPCAAVSWNRHRDRPVLEDEYQKITPRPVTSRSAALHVRWVLPASHLPCTSSDSSFGGFWIFPDRRAASIESSREFLDEDA
jgi:hypothetical protein